MQFQKKSPMLYVLLLTRKSKYAKRAIESQKEI